MEVYRATYDRIQKRNERFYRRYPGDVAKVREIVAHLLDHEARNQGAGLPLPAGGQLTARRFLQIGLELSQSGYMETLHWLLEDAWVPQLSGTPKQAN